MAATSKAAATHLTAVHRVPTLRLGLDFLDFLVYLLRHVLQIYAVVFCENSDVLKPLLAIHEVNLAFELLPQPLDICPLFSDELASDGFGYLGHADVSAVLIATATSPTTAAAATTSSKAPSTAAAARGRLTMSAKGAMRPEDQGRSVVRMEGGDIRFRTMRGAPAAAELSSLQSTGV